MNERPYQVSFMKNPSTFFRFFLESLRSPSQSCSLVAQSVRQFLSGSVATMVDLVSFQVAVWLDVNIFLSAFLSFCLALLTNFCTSKYYVFGVDREQKYSWQMQFFVYILLALVSLGIVQASLFFFAVFLMFPPILAKVFALPAVFFWSLLSGRYFIFRVRRKSDV